MDLQTRDTILQLAVCAERFARRYRLCDGWSLLQKSVWVALLGAVLIQLGGRYWPVEGLWRWSLLPLAVWLLAVPFWVLLKRPSIMQVARRLDGELGLKERVGTAFALRSLAGPGLALPDGAGDELIALQQQDALETLRAIQPREALPLVWQKRALAGAGAAAIALAALLYLPNPMDQVLAERAAVEEAVEAEAEKVAALRDEVAESDALSPDEKEKLLNNLDALAADLRADPQDREEALARLSEMAEQLRRQLDENRFAQQQMLEALAAQLQALSQSESNSADPGLEESLDALEQLAEMLDDLDADEQAALAEAMAQLAANAAQAGDGSLAQALAAMGQAAGVGNAEAMAQAAADAAQALNDSTLVAAQHGELQDALDQLQQSRDAIAQAGQGEGQGEGQGLAQGEGQGNGQGGMGAGAGGTTADQLPAARRTGQGQLLEGNDRGSMMGDMGEQVYVPWERRPQTDEQSFIAGQETGQGETQVRQQQNPLPGLDSSTLIPYQQVYTEYVESANQAIERSTIPPGLKAYVRDYFVELEP